MSIKSVYSPMRCNIIFKYLDAVSTKLADLIVVFRICYINDISNIKSEIKHHFSVLFCFLCLAAFGQVAKCDI